MNTNSFLLHYEQNVRIYSSIGMYLNNSTNAKENSEYILDIVTLTYFKLKELKITITNYNMSNLNIYIGF